MFRSKSNPFTRCKKHPKHKQSPGVCSICLVDKLSKLPATSSSSFSVNSRGGGGGRRSNYNNNNNSSGQSSSSSISSLSSSDISSCASSLMSPATVALTTRSAYLRRINFKPGPSSSKSQNIYSTTDNKMKLVNDDENCNTSTRKQQGTTTATSSRFSWSKLLLGSRRKSNVNHDNRQLKAQTISHSQPLMRQIASRV